MMCFISEVLSQKTDWVKVFGGGGYNMIMDSDYDNDGNLYAAGIFTGTVDFNPHIIISDEKTSEGAYDVFISKYDGNGAYLWTKTFGGTSNVMVNALNILEGANSYNGIYLAGKYLETADFDPSSSSDTYTASDSYDSYVTLLNLDGDYLKTIVFKGSGNEDIRDIKAMNGKYVYVGFFGDSFDLLPNNTGGEIQSAGDNDIVIAAFSPAGGLLLAKHIGGTGDDKALCLELDQEDNYYVGGEFSNSFNFETTSVSAVDSTDGFVARFNSDGNFQWVNRIGDTARNLVNALTVKEDTVWSSVSFEGKIVYVSGYVNGFPVFKTIYSEGGYDILLKKELTDGTTLPTDYAHLASSGDIGIGGMARDSRNNILITGHFDEGEIDLNPSEQESNTHITVGSGDVFLGKYNGNYDYIWSYTYGGSGEEMSYFLTTRKNDTISLGGRFMDEVDFNPAGDSMVRSAVSNYDAFFMNILPYNDETEIISFKLDEQEAPAVIDNSTHTVNIEVPYGTDLTALAPAIEVSDRAIVQPSNGNGVDFSNSVIYTVAAEDSVNKQEWTIKVCDDNSAAEILSFELSSQTRQATIDESNHTINIEVESGTDISKLCPEITVSDSATIEPCQGDTLNFTNPVIYTVTAEDSSTCDWTVTVSTEEAAGLKYRDSDKFKIYPNPVDEQIIIKSLHVEYLIIELFDITGALVKSKDSYGNTHNLNIYNLTPGNYVIRIRTNKQKLIKKWIIVE